MIVLINWILILFSLLIRRNWRSPIHFYYENILFQFVLLINLPATLFAEQLGFSVNVSIDESSYISLLVLALTISIQWFLIAIMLGPLFRLRNRDVSLE